MVNAQNRVAVEDLSRTCLINEFSSNYNVLCDANKCNYNLLRIMYKPIWTLFQELFEQKFHLVIITTLKKSEKQ